MMPWSLIPRRADNGLLMRPVGLMEVGESLDTAREVGYDAHPLRRRAVVRIPATETIHTQESNGIR
jgi:hypothetical protein